jgi:hypothetical protein
MKIEGYPMPNLLYVDNSNIWIEGMHVAAVQNGLAPDIWSAMELKIFDKWSMDFGKLFQFAGGDRKEVKKATLFGSRPPQNDTLWKIAKSKGFEVVVYDRNIANREKKIDTDIATTMIEDSFTILDIGKDEMTLVAGDSDYVPAIEKLRKRGVTVDVVFWNHASKELKKAASNFINLDPFLNHLSR